jgi:hypothetical protein
MIDGYAQEDQAKGAAEIALEQETGFVPYQPARFIDSSANLYHAINLLRS